MRLFRISHLHRLAILAALTAAISMVVLVAQGQKQNPVPRAKQPPAAAAATAAPAAPASGIENGHVLFSKYLCYSCHGSDGQGGAGSRLTGSALPEFDVFRSYLRKPAATMPPYRSSAITDGELIDIYAYLKSIPPPASAKNIPLLNQ